MDWLPKAAAAAGRAALSRQKTYYIRRQLKSLQLCHGRFSHTDCDCLLISNEAYWQKSVMLEHIIPSNLTPSSDNYVFLKLLRLAPLLKLISINFTHRNEKTNGHAMTLHSKPNFLTCVYITG